MPRTKRPHKPGDHFIVFDLKLAPGVYASNTGSKTFRVDPIRINHDLPSVDAAGLEVAALDFRDDKNTRRGVKVQTLVTLQQIEASDAVPMLAHPNFRAVVFEQQRSLNAVRGHHPGPTKSRISLVNKVRS